MAAVAQAGAIVVRRVDTQARILLVTAKRNPGQWILPKGHVEHGESAEDAALREALEEGGVSGTLVGDAGSVSFRSLGRQYHVRYFVVATRDEGDPESGRKLAWLSYEDALERIAYDNTRRVLREAEALIEAAARRGPC
jgi:ADP-ribose pyrophosphatase YjhB (NUDIX family)